MTTAVCPNPSCAAPLPLDDRSAGGRVTCPRCRQSFEVAATASTAVGNLEETVTPWLPGSAPPSEVPARRGPPPLPPRTKPKLRPIPLAVSAVSVLVILLSLIGTVKQFGSKKEETVAPPQATPERWAAVTIESFGVRLVVIDCVRTSGTAELTLVHATNRDWQLGKLPPDPAARPATFDELERVLAPYYDALAQYNVPPERRLVACNSGVVPADGPSRDKLLGWVQGSVRKALNLDVDAVSAGQEAEYGARGSIPLDAPTRMQSVSLDMGGSSTKYGYFDTYKTFKGAKFDVGASGAEARIADLARSKKVSFANAAKDWKATADDEVRKLASSTPPLANYPKCYLLGGAPWAVTVIAHPAEFARPVDSRAVNVRLTPYDIETARDLVERAPNFAALQQSVLAKLPPGTDRVPLEVELNQISRAFSLQRVLAGATLLKSFADACDFAGKDVRFYTRSLHAWPVGYILVKGKFE